MSTRKMQEDNDDEYESDWLFEMTGYCTTTIIVKIEQLVGGVTDLIHGRGWLFSDLSPWSWRTWAIRCTCSQFLEYGSCLEPSPYLCRVFLGSRNGRMPVPSLST